MNPLSARPPGSRENLLDLQITLSRLRWPYADRLARQPDVRSVGVGVGIDSHRSNPHAIKCADDPAGNLATVGYENLGKHLLTTENTGDMEVE